jgi:hypothetical protein
MIPDRYTLTPSGTVGCLNLLIDGVFTASIAAAKPDEMKHLVKLANDQVACLLFTGGKDVYASLEDNAADILIQQTNLKDIVNQVSTQ